jgi:hypothetical protein
MSWLERLKVIEQSPVILQAPRPIDDPQQIRLIRLINKGVSLDEAKEIAQRLELRDSQSDDRILCYECHHLRGYVGFWRCGNWQQAGIAKRESGDGLGDFVNLFQRCGGFNQTKENAL